MTRATFVQNKLFPPTIERAAAGTATRGLVARAWHAIANERLRRREEEVAHFIRQRGGRMTDNLERDIERYFLTSH